MMVNVIIEGGGILSTKTKFIRTALWVAAFFNLGGMFVFAFPEMAIGPLVGLPTDVPVVYRAVTAVFILLFGGAYAWLARQPVIDRPLIGLSAIGKAGVFAAIFILWLFSAVSGWLVLLISGDLVFAILFVWWLNQTK